MPITAEKLREEVISLLTLGSHIDQRETADAFGKKLEDPNNKVQFIRIEYQRFYTRCLPIVTFLAPDRLKEFMDNYEGIKVGKIADLNVLSYGISHYLSHLKVSGPQGFESFPVFSAKLSNQLNILSSCLSRIDSAFSNIMETLAAELFDDELHAAEELLKKNHLRAAGALCGVTLERHLALVAARRSVKGGKQSPTIADLNEALKKAEVYDVPDWRFIQHLADLRNIAVHAKGKEPTSEEITNLIRGTAKVLKTIW